MSWSNGNDRPSAKNGEVRDGVQEATQARAAAMGYAGFTRVLAAAERDLRDGGIGVDVDIVGLSRFATKVDPYMDLGILTDDKRRTRITPGRKNLLPDKRLASLQSRIRTNLYHFSHVVGALGGYRYVTNGAFMEWMGRHDALVAEFYRVRDEYVSRYEELVGILKDDYAEMAEETWQTLDARGNADERAFTQKYDLDAFKEAVIAMAVSKLPTIEEIQREVQVIVKVATWMLPAEQAEDILLREQHLSAAQAEAEERNYMLREDRARSDAMEQEWTARGEEAKSKRGLIAFAEEEEKRAIEQAKVAFARQAITEMSNPLDEMLNGLRERMYQSARQILGNVQKHNRVVGKQVTAMENMIGLFRMLNSAGDAELETKINDLGTALEVKGTATKRDASAIMDALSGVAAVAITKAEALVSETLYDEFDALDF